MRKAIIFSLLLLIILLSGCKKQTYSDCSESQIFSGKSCSCIDDNYGCKGLNKENCELNPNCFSFSRSGTCSCPSCEIWMEHQCLPK